MLRLLLCDEDGRLSHRKLCLVVSCCCNLLTVEEAVFKFNEETSRNVVTEAFRSGTLEGAEEMLSHSHRLLALPMLLFKSSCPSVGAGVCGRQWDLALSQTMRKLAA